MIGRRMPYYAKRGIGGIDANTVLMLHGEDFTDASLRNNTIANNGVTLNTTISKFGGSSFYFNGGKLSVPSSVLFSGNSTFTIDLWVYKTTEKGANVILSWGGSNEGNGVGGVISSAGANSLMYYASGYRINSTTISFVVNTWNHIAFVGDKSSLSLYLNGALVGTEELTYSLGNCTVQLGMNEDSSTEYFTGYMDEIRFSNIVRWTSDFTPPTEPYSE